jgi:large subunit ribosomal protein L32
MAVPKRKTSTARRDKRRSNWKLQAPALATCGHCGAVKQPHRVCGTCGFYNGVEVVRVSAF